jgi:hypothetical protein
MDMFVLSFLPFNSFVETGILQGLLRMSARNFWRRGDGDGIEGSEWLGEEGRKEGRTGRRGSYLKALCTYL